MLFPSTPVFAAFDFTFEAQETAKLPFYTGSLLRGSLGHSLRRMSCTLVTPTCADCLSAADCPYSRVFETPVSVAVGRWHSSHVPHPFIIEPRLVPKDTYLPGELLSFRLILVGDGIDYLPDMIMAFAAAAETGLGLHKARFRLKRVVDALGSKQRTVYDGKRLILDFPVNTKSLPDAADEVRSFDRTQVSLFFMTPTRVKDRAGESPETINLSFQAELAFSVVMSSLLRRLSWLAEAHCDDIWEIDHRELLSKAERVRTLRSSLRWYDLQRYSTRQKAKSSLGGLVGRVLFEGDVGEFLPFLKMGEYLHIGQGTGFGLGKYILEPGG